MYRKELAPLNYLVLKKLSGKCFLFSFHYGMKVIGTENQFSSRKEEERRQIVE